MRRLSAGKRLPVCIAKVVICLWHDKNLNKGFIKIFFVYSCYFSFSNLSSIEMVYNILIRLLDPQIAFISIK